MIECRHILMKDVNGTMKYENIEKKQDVALGKTVCAIKTYQPRREKMLLCRISKQYQCYN